MAQKDPTKLRNFSTWFLPALKTGNLKEFKSRNLVFFLRYSAFTVITEAHHGRGDEDRFDTERHSSNSTLALNHV